MNSTESNPLVAMPAQKAEECRKQLTGVCVEDWDSLNEREKSRELAKHPLIIAFAYFSRASVLSEPVFEALSSYLQGGRTVIFLIPTPACILEPYDFMLSGYVPRIESREAWHEHYEDAWSGIILDAMRRLIDWCISHGVKRTVDFREIALDQSIEHNVSGKAKESLKKYLNKHAPPGFQYKIVVLRRKKGKYVEDPDTMALATYNFARGEHVAVKVHTKGGGAAILLPFNANNVTAEDIQWLLAFHAASGRGSGKRRTRKKKTPARKTPVLPGISDPKPDTLYLLYDQNKAAFQVGTRVSTTHLPRLPMQIAKALMEKMMNDISEHVAKGNRGFLSFESIVRTCSKVNADWKVSWFRTDPRTYKRRIITAVSRIRDSLQEVADTDIENDSKQGYRLSPYFSAYAASYVGRHQ